MIPTVPSQDKVDKWYRDKDKYESQIKDYEKKMEKRTMLLERYPHLENQMIEWREKYRLERIERLRKKRDELTQ